MKRIILASGSPRRKMLLESAGLAPEVEIYNVDEHHLAGETPHEYLERTVRAKCAPARERHTGEEICIISADTIVVHRGKILGKPANKEDAARTLAELSGDTHTVMTGVCVAPPANGRELLFIVETAVQFASLSHADIEWYISTGEPMDKAGAYGIQGGAAVFVERIDGSYTNVVGLPLFETVRALHNLDA